MSARLEELKPQARALVLQKQLASAELLSRSFACGKPIAMQLMQWLQATGVIGPAGRLGDRQILLDPRGNPIVGPGHNSAPRATATDDRLRLLTERIERLEEEKKGISDDIRDVYSEAKAVGYDPKIMRQIVRLRKMDPNDRSEMEMVLDTYKSALGIG